MPSPSFVQPQGIRWRTNAPDAPVNRKPRHLLGASMLVGETTTPSDQLRRFLESSKEGRPLESLVKADEAFSRLKSRNTNVVPPPEIVKSVSDHISPASDHYDIIIAGGTLGIFYATALQKRGWRVCVVERGKLMGRLQEWNISRDELGSLVQEGVLSEHQLESAIATECHVPGRIGFASETGEERVLRVGGVLNVGIAPDKLVSYAGNNFTDAGGALLDKHKVSEVIIAPNGIEVTLQSQQAQTVEGSLGAGGTGLAGASTGEERRITGRLLIDAMGASSPIAEQSRGGRKPDGVCITVGSCMNGPWPKNDSPDLIYSFQPISKERSTQYFWEAFPVQREPDCRTTYMFAYGPCEEGRQSLTEALEDYWATVSEYQNVNLDEMSVKRILFGFFPTYYRDNPTDIAFDRVLPVGDAGGLQSPISFGGFGCCLRHLSRITNALDEALKVPDDSLLQKSQLQLLQWYLPSLSVTGLFNKAMQVQPGQTTAGPFLGQNGINEVLWSNMQAMAKLGEDIQRPFLQDVVTADGLAKTLGVMAIKDPQLAIKMTAFLGPVELIRWSRHFFALLGYAAVLPLLSSLKKRFGDSENIDVKQRFWLNRAADAAEYGSGADAKHHSR